MFEVIFIAFFLLMVAEVLLFLFLNLPFPKSWKSAIFRKVAESESLKHFLKVQLLLCILAGLFYMDMSSQEHNYSEQKHKLRSKSSFGAGTFGPTQNSRRPRSPTRSSRSSATSTSISSSSSPSQSPSPSSGSNSTATNSKPAIKTNSLPSNATTPNSTPKIDASITITQRCPNFMLYLHDGQFPLELSHSSRHFGWKACPQPTSYTRSPSSTTHRQIAHYSLRLLTIFFSADQTCPCMPRVTRIPSTCGKSLLSHCITRSPEAVAPREDCPCIISSPNRLNSSTLKLASPLMRRLPGSVLTIKQEQLILSSSSCWRQRAYWLGQPANFMLRRRLTCRSMTASDISTWASGSDNDITPAKGEGCCCASSILYCRQRSSYLALRLALTLSIISLMVSAFLCSYYFSLNYFSCRYCSLLFLSYSYFCLSSSANRYFSFYFSCYCLWISSYLVISGIFYFIYVAYSWTVGVKIVCAG